MTLAARIQRADERLFRRVARLDHGVLDRRIPSLTTAADHGRLWVAAAGAIALTGPTGRRAATRGLVSLAVASAVANGPAKWSVRRRRPMLVDVPSLRQLRRQPVTTSFPSGHAASAAAFTTGVALESAVRGAPVAALAAGVAYGRVHTGVHYPSDVAAGAVLGVAAAVAVRRWWPAGAPSAAAARPADAPTLPDGAGLVVVVNEAAGSADADDVAAQVTADLPRAEVVRSGAGDDLREVFRAGAARARVLGVAGGDGTINCAASVALAAGVPLAVFPAGTLNHFAADLGLACVRDVTQAVARGEAVDVSVGSAGEAGVFLNTLSLGVYPELVRRRERHERWLGKWAAFALALAQVLRADPVAVEVDGVPRRLWLFFAGNGRYDRSALPTGGRTRLDEPLLDVRMVDADRGLARLRVALAALSGRLRRSAAYSSCVTDRVALAVEPGTSVAVDGEARRAPRRLALGPDERRLVVYCPARR